MPCYELDGIVPVVAPSAFVHPQASLIGDVIVGPGCYIGPFASLRGDFGRISVGAGSNVQDSAVLHAFPGEDTVLEPHSHVGHSAVLHGCRVGSYALIGIGATLLDGVAVGEDTLVGAGALVTAGTHLPPRSLVFGSPAKVQGELDESTIAWKRRGVHLYEALAARSLASLAAVTPLAEPEAGRRRMPTTAADSRPLPAAQGRYRP